MRIIEIAKEAREIAGLLPEPLTKEEPDWDAVQSGCFSLNSSLIYSDVAAPASVKYFPALLRALGQEKCFIFNHKSLLLGRTTDNCDIAIEVTSDCDPTAIDDEIVRAGQNRDRYLSVFYLVGDFGVVSPEADWIIFARPDTLAVFSSDDEITYSDFHTTWWPLVNRK
jgi:hypothetical protein